MSLSREQVQACINIVAADADCRKVIWSPGHPESAVKTVVGVLIGGLVYWRILERMGLAGWVRNAMAAVVLDDRSYQKLICGGIVAVTVAALERGKASVPGLAEAEGAAREPGGWFHFATLIRMKDNTEYVLDWHKTLRIPNPWVSRHHEWREAKNEQAFADFQGFEDEKPVLHPSLAPLVGKWRVQVSRWTWIYEFDSRGFVKWTDPFNGQTGKGHYTWGGSVVNLRWDGSQTVESWNLPVQPAKTKGHCKMTEGEFSVVAVKMAG